MCCPKFGKNRMKKNEAGKIGRDSTCRLSPIWLSVEFFWIRWFPNYFPYGTLSKWRILNYGQFAKLPNNSARSCMWFWAGNRISNLIPAKSERKSKQVQEKKIGITLEILKLESDSIWSELMMGFISHIRVHTNRTYLSNTLTNLCIALYCVVLDCIVILIYCYVDIIQYNAVHKFVGVLDNPLC